MKKQSLQPGNLEQIGRSVFKATRPRAEEIEKIVTSPQLLASIKDRIEADENIPRQEKLTFDKRLYFPLWTYPAAAGGLFVLVVCSALIFFRTEGLQPVAEQMPVTEIQTSVLPSKQSSSTEERETTFPGVKKLRNPLPFTFKTKSSNPGRKAQKPNPLKPSKPVQSNSPQIFYSLSPGGNLENNGEDLRVIRAELSKSELFALGINLPLENEMIKIKTDLLIGENGIARAIRFVGKR